MGDGDVGERAEAGGDAVDDGAALDGVGHHGPGGRHPVGDCRGEHGAGATAGDVDDVGERETVAVDGDRAHPATVLPVPSAASGAWRGGRVPAVYGTGGQPRSRGSRLLSAVVAAGALGLVVLGVLTAVRSIQPAARPSFDAGPAGSRTVAGPGTPTPAPRPQPAAEITLAFAGDVHFEGRVSTRLETDPATALGPVATELSRADLAMVNLETAIADGGTPEPKEFYFRAPATAFTALRAAGVDVTTMANNHGADFGRPGLDRLARRHRRQPLPHRRASGRTRPGRTRRTTPRSAGTGSRCSAPARSGTGRCPRGPPGRTARASRPRTPTGC